MGSVGDCFYKGFPGIEDNIGNDRKRDSEAENRNANQDHKQPAGIVIHRNKGNHPHADIRKGKKAESAEAGAIESSCAESKSDRGSGDSSR